MSPTDEELKAQLVTIISDGFNRSLGALRDAGAVDTSEMDLEYRGVGSRYYDLVTEQIEYTASNAVSSLRSLFA